MDAVNKGIRIILKGGPCDDERDRDVPEDAVIYRRSLVSPQARYRRTEAVDAEGFRIFEHFPLPAGESESAAAIYDFPRDYVARRSAVQDADG